MVNDAATRQKIATTLERDVRAGGLGALCFLPRHGIRLIVGRTIQDLVICYQCGQVEVYTNGRPVRGVGIAGDAAYLDGMLTNAPNKPLPPAVKGGG